MGNTKQRRLLRFAKELTSLDPEVFRKHVKDTAKYTKTLAKIEDNEFSESSLTGSDLNALEAIVMSFGRPVLFVENDRAIMPESGEWQDRLREHADAISENIKRVGRIEVDGHPQQAFMEAGEEFFLGTCSVIGSKLLLTNRHVASEFCNLDGSIKAGMVPRVDFVEEVERDPDQEIRITRALEIGSDYDYAILEVEDTSLPTPVKFASSANDLSTESQYPLAYIVGYPAFDTRNPTDLQNRLFAGKFNVKRLAPGRLRKIVGAPPYVGHRGYDRALELDYTSLGGNSGSPVFDLTTGLVIGLHYAGRYAEANYAVPIWSILERIRAFTQRARDEGGQPMSNSYIETILKERALYMPLGKARQIAESGFNPRSANEVTNAAAALVVLGHFGETHLMQRLGASLASIHQSLRPAVNQVTGTMELVRNPGWDDWCPTLRPPWTPSPTFPQPPLNPLAMYNTEPVDGRCIAGTVGGAMVGGVAGAGVGGIGAAVGAIGGGLAGAANSGCFD